MKKFLASILKKILVKFEDPPKKTQEVEEKKSRQVAKPSNSSKPKTKILSPKKLPQFQPSVKPQEIIPRDFTEMMEVPFLALSKNRRTPIVYENPERGVKVNITRHTGHFLASIYDWDVIVFVASKMQEILNSSTDLPPRTMTFPRHELLKALRKHDGKKEEKDLRASLARLKLTGIETTIRNEDYRYEAGFGFLDSWGYTKRKDIKEIHITLSQWLYDGICAKGALLRVSTDYFELTSGLKRFLYRTARKHVGNSDKTWEFSVEKLYEKSGSEREFKKFKMDLKTAIQANDLPEYEVNWVERNKSALVSFKKRKEVMFLEVPQVI